MQQITHRLIVYDIRHPRRLNRVYKCCCQYALPLQNSVFLFQGPPKLWEQCQTEILKRLDISEDAVWVFELDHSHTCEQLGKKPLPHGMVLEGNTCLSALII